MLTISALSEVSHEQDGHVGHTCLSQAPVHRLLQLQLPPPSAPQGRTGHVSCVTGVCRTWASSPGTRHAQNSGNPAAALQNGPPDQTQAPGPRLLSPHPLPGSNRPSCAVSEGERSASGNFTFILSRSQDEPSCPSPLHLRRPQPCNMPSTVKMGTPGEEAPQWEATSALKSSIRWWERVVSPACRDNPGKTVLFF